MTAAILLLLSACADNPEVAENSTADEPATSAPADSDDPGATPTGDASTESELLAFSAETVGGDQFNGAELAGEPVALWFWAPW